MLAVDSVRYYGLRKDEEASVCTQIRNTVALRWRGIAVKLWYSTGGNRRNDRLLRPQGALSYLECCHDGSRLFSSR